MFNHSYFGDTTRKSSTEIQLKQSELNNNPQIVEFAETKSVQPSIAITAQDARFVNKGVTQFNVTDFNNTNFSLNTAGEMLSTEADYYVSKTLDVQMHITHQQIMQRLINGQITLVTQWVTL